MHFFLYVPVCPRFWEGSYCIALISSIAITTNTTIPSVLLLSRVLKYYSPVNNKNVKSTEA